MKERHSRSITATSGGKGEYLLKNLFVGILDVKQLFLYQAVKMNT